MNADGGFQKQSEQMRPPEMQIQRLAYVDALRGWAILGVMLVHSAQTVHGQWSAREYFAYGALGVQLFYLLSAFTLCWVSYYVYNDTGSWRSFFIRRYFRIAPMYYIGIAVCLVTCTFASKDGLWGPIVRQHVWWSGGSESVSAANVFANLSFLHGINPFWINSLVPGGWSIAAECAFYTVFPFLFLHASTVGRACLLTAMSMAVAAGLHLVLKGVQPVSPLYMWQSYLFFWFPAQLPFFCMGIALFHFCRWLSARPFANSSSLGLVLISSSLLLLVFLVNGGKVWFFPRHWTFGFAFVGLASGLASYPMLLFVNFLTVKLGEVSYSCYIWHWFAISIVTAIRDSMCSEIIGGRPFVSFIGTFCSVAALSGILSWLTWNYIESPAIRLGKTLSKRVHS